MLFIYFNALISQFSCLKCNLFPPPLHSEDSGLDMIVRVRVMVDYQERTPRRTGNKRPTPLSEWVVRGVRSLDVRVLVVCELWWVWIVSVCELCLECGSCWQPRISTWNVSLLGYVVWEPWAVCVGSSLIRGLPFILTVAVVYTTVQQLFIIILPVACVCIHM